MEIRTAQEHLHYCGMFIKNLPVMFCGQPFTRHVSCIWIELAVWQHRVILLCYQDVHHDCVRSGMSCPLGGSAPLHTAGHRVGHESLTALLEKWGGECTVIVYLLVDSQLTLH